MKISKVRLSRPLTNEPDVTSDESAGDDSEPEESTTPIAKGGRGRGTPGGSGTGRGRGRGTGRGRGRGTGRKRGRETERDDSDGVAVSVAGDSPAAPSDETTGSSPSVPIDEVTGTRRKKGKGRPRLQSLLGQLRKQINQGSSHEEAICQYFLTLEAEILQENLHRPEFSAVLGTNRQVSLLPSAVSDVDQLKGMLLANPNPYIEHLLVGGQQFSIVDAAMLGPLGEVADSAVVNDALSAALDRGETSIQQLPLFEGLVLGDTGVLGSGDAGLGVPVASADILLSAGGPVWALDWCPRLPSDTTREDYLAVGVHSPLEPTHVIGRAYTGKNVIQLWRIGDQNSLLQTKSPEDIGDLDLNNEVALEPTLCCELMFAIAHEGSCVFDLKWCQSQEAIVLPPPTSDADPSSIGCGRLGILASVLGDGCLYVHSIPHPRSINRWIPPTTAPTARILSLPPICIAKIEGRRLWCVDWSPHTPDMLATGSTDGGVAVWKILPKIEEGEGSSSTLHSIALLWHVRGHMGLVRRVSWCPDVTHTIATCGNDGCLRIWDTRELTQPLYAYHVGRGWVTDFGWQVSMPYLYVVMDDQFVRVLDLREESMHSFCIHRDHIWCVCSSSGVSFCRVTSGGDDGQVLLFLAPEIATKSKNRIAKPILRQLMRVGWSEKHSAALITKAPGPPRTYEPGVGAAAPIATFSTSLGKQSVNYAKQIKSSDETKQEPADEGGAVVEASASAGAGASAGAIVEASSAAAQENSSSLRMPNPMAVITRLAANRQNIRTCRWTAVGLSCGYVRCMWYI